MNNKYAIGTVVGAALLGLAKSNLLGSKNDGITVKSVEELLRYANDPSLAPLVTKVYLAGKNLTTLPPEIGNLKNLEMLDLSSNPLTTLPPEIGNLKNLEMLHLDDNQLTTIPKEIGNLTNLEYLDLSSNLLTTLPPEIGKLTNLKWLYLGENLLTTLPPEIGKIKDLEYLDLEDNNLTTLPSEIGKLTNLERLSLHDNPNLKITLNVVVYVLNTYQNTYVATILLTYIHQQTIPARQTIRMR